MKKMLVLLAACMLVSAAGAQDLKIKRGKVTMSEEYYNSLQSSVQQLEAAQKRIAELETKLAELQARPPMTSFRDSASYAIGRDMYGTWRQRQLPLNYNMVAQAIEDDAQGFSQLSDQQAGPLLQRFQQDYVNRQRANIQQNIDAGAKYMQEISNNKSVYTTPSGLKYRKLQDGNGKKPKTTDIVKVNYTGKLIDGTKFDSSYDHDEPAVFPVNRVIPGWTEGLQLMDEGSKYMLYIPYNLGYGEQPMGTIPPGSTLVFEVELLEINPKQ